MFIWATDQDTLDNDLLNAVLQPDGLGKFKDKNGVGGSGSDWESVDLEEGCFWSGKYPAVTAEHGTSQLLPAD